jgi:hypothetical protein
MARNLTRSVDIAKVKSHDALQKGSKLRRLVDTTLLQTCRIVYFETASLTLGLTVLHACVGTLDRLRQRILLLTARNVFNLVEIDFWGHGSPGLLDKLGRFSRLPQFQSSRLTLWIDVDDSPYWLSQVHCGLSMQGTFLYPCKHCVCH